MQTGRYDQRNFFNHNLHILLVTGKMLYQAEKRAFVSSIIVGCIESLLYPLLLLLLWNIFSFLLVGKALALSGQGIFIVVTFFLLLVGQQVLALVNENARSLLRAESLQNIHAQILDKMSHIPYPFFEDNDFQAEYNLVIGEASYRPAMLIDALLNSLVSLLAFLGIIITLLAIAPLLVILLLVSIVLAGVEAHFRRRIIDFQTSSAPDLFRMQYLTQKSIDATWQRDIRVHQSSILQDEFRSLSERYLRSLKLLLRRFQAIRLSIGIIISAFVALAIGGIIWLISKGALGLAQIGILLPALYLALQQGRAFSTSLGSLIECLLYIEKVLQFLDLSFDHSTTTSTLTPIQNPDSSQILDIRVQSLSFQYPDSEKTVLSNISCQFSTGIHVIVGPNGAGKSTLVKLLAGLFSPTSGSINVQIPNNSLHALERTVLFQEPSHLYLTIRQNITMSFEKKQDEDRAILQALERVGLADVVGQLPERIDTVVGAGFGGQTDLSGGQWQRLALARLLYHDSPVIILDEPVASLDPDGERAVFEIFSQFAKSKIIILTTHRYDSIPRHAQITVLVDGIIVERGTHDDLLRKQQDYWTLYTAYRERG